jgi:phosphoribosylaminoimidazole-succinocarboxamide synthase
MKNYCDQIQSYLPYALHYSSLGIGIRKQGKVRDIYDLQDSLLLVTTDRVSAFDRVLADIPLKGQVLNQIAAWWFEKTKHIIPNHVLSVPDPNVILSKKCRGNPFT